MQRLPAHPSRDHGGEVWNGGVPRHGVWWGRRGQGLGHPFELEAGALAAYGGFQSAEEVLGVVARHGSMLLKKVRLGEVGGGARGGWARASREH